MKFLGVSVEWIDVTWSPMDLVVDRTTGRLDYKKLALSTTALLQSFTWLRLSMDYKVSSMLQDPWLWIVFYCVVAGHDLLKDVIKAKWGNNNNAAATDAAQPPAGAA